MTEAQARELLERARLLLLDFDGPVCSVFAGFPADVVAEQLRDVLADGRHVDFPEPVAAATDPFDVFRYAATVSDEDARMVNAAFTAHEVEAIATATPAPGAHELIRAWKRAGRELAIVSNNSAHAVRAYLDLHGLHRYVDHIAARTSEDPEQLKPRTWLLDQALTHFHVAPAEAVLIGDSPTDVEAARSAGCPVIGYANKPGKERTLVNADVIITSVAAKLAPEARV
ncbi:HAD family hydrolase [Sciscionella sediminilitoris]|uniref:HAD family hydrolase n=1 Tax=Sciscionella sediminilitoris TaxID=1445613 RepID=UPI0004DF1623|nr:HAD-IA family hydrolase [Sciscionella sp. SE31]